jgi:hypothetical protein
VAARHLVKLTANFERNLEETKAFLVEASNGIDSLKHKLEALAKDGEIREYVMSHYLVLYTRFDATIYLLSIRHHRQFSFDFQSLWAGQP